MMHRRGKISFSSELKRRNVYRVGLAYVIASWLILQILDTVIPIIGAPEWAPKLVLTMLLLGLPLVLIFSWAYELTPEGIKRERDVDRSQSTTTNTGRRLDTIIIGIFVVSVGWIILDGVFPGVESESSVPTAQFSGQPSIAVLPFLNLSDDENSGYFSDGLADTLLHMLAQSSELRVAARTSSFQFRDPDVDVTSIANQLNVAAILEGSVQRSGDQIRVTAQLIDASNGFHLWSANFDRKFENVFAIQDEIATEVVAALKVTLLGDEATKLREHPTNNIEAYQDYLLGLHQLEEFSFESLPRAVSHFENAVSKDPDYAIAWAGIGQAYLAMFDTGLIDKTTMLSRTQAAIQNALDIDDTLPIAISLHAAILYISGDDEDVESLLQQAIANGPNNVDALAFYAEYLNRTGRSDEALHVLKDALKLDPLSIDLLRESIRSSDILDDHEAALIFAKRIRDVNPHSPVGYYLAGFTEYAKGDWAKGLMWMIEASEIDAADPELPTQVGDYYLDLNLPDEAERWYLRAGEIDPEHPMVMTTPLVLHMFRQENEAALRVARKVLAAGVGERKGSRTFALYAIARGGDLTGDYSEFVERTREFYPGLLESPPVGVDDDRYLATRLGHALNVRGETLAGRALLDRAIEMQTEFDATFGVSYNSYLIWAAAGDVDKALYKLSQIAETPHVLDGFDYLISPPVWAEPIHASDLFQDMLAAHKAKAAEQREELRALNDGRYP